MRSSLMRFALRFFFGVGFIMLGYTGGTIAYAELYQRYQSGKFEHRIDTPLTKDAAIVVAIAAKPDLTEGDLIGKLVIPRMGIAVMVLQGVKEANLCVGAGHVPGTPLPGIEGNVAIATHLPELTLISCYPFYFVGAAPKRFIVHAIPTNSTLP